MEETFEINKDCSGVIGKRENMVLNYIKEYDGKKLRVVKRSRVSKKRQIIKTGGLTIEYNKGLEYSYWVDNELQYHKNIKCYDEFGNLFYANFCSLEEANMAVNRLYCDGKRAVIGVAAPYITKGGIILSLRNSRFVGVYIVDETKIVDEKKKEDVLVRIIRRRINHNN